MATVREISEAFHVFYEALRDPEFSKSLRLNEWTERELLPLVRTFLLGWFGQGQVAPEVMSALPGKITGYGRLDFVVRGVAVELAVRCRGGSRSNLSATVNADEIKKLMKFDGLAVLILLDFTNDPLDDQAIEKFREWHSLLHGRHKKSPFNVSHHYRDPDTKLLVHHTINVRV
ncbi:hypothetical protein [Novosphingobium lentum]|uniref:hypothetical protein n=1 Tax=Novosphingobium lentum TaxID=145287 RepID=UPI0009FDB1E0|nr:hypothetical protein [Novosphingobium lentum]